MARTRPVFGVGFGTSGLLVSEGYVAAAEMQGRWTAEQYITNSFSVTDSGSRHNLYRFVLLTDTF